MENSLFTRLPPELVSEVFLCCLPPTPSFAACDAPLVLTHVCHAWRAHSLKTSGLWAYIAVPSWQECSPHTAAALFRLWLERAGAAPLNIDINMFDRDVQVFPSKQKSEELNAKLEDMLAALAPHRARVRSFQGVFPALLMPAVGVREMQNAEQIGYCGALDSILFLDEEEEENLQTKLDLGPPRDQLRRLAICGCAADMDSVKVQTQLTHLELVDLNHSGDLSQETAFDLLKSLPNLKIVAMDVARYERRDYNASSERVSLPNLEVLFVTWSFPADVDMLLNSIAAPSLLKLGLRGVPITPQRPWNCLHDFLNASQAPLRRLSLGDFGDVDIRLLDSLGYCSELAHLTLNHIVVPDAVLRGLTCTDEVWDTRLLPSLEVLNMGVCEGFMVDSLVHFLKSRSADVLSGFSKLQDVAIMYCVGISEEYRSLLETCGVENLVLEAVEDNTEYQPFARVVETHQELLALLYQGQDEEDPEELDYPEGSQELDDLGDGQGEEEESVAVVVTNSFY